MIKEWKHEKTGQTMVATINEEPSMAEQQFKDECDINKIMEKYQKTGILPVSQRQGVYADLTSVGSYQDALHAVMKAEEAFLQLPSEVRTRFRNNPQELIDFLEDEKNYDESVKLGLRDPKVRTEQAVPAEQGKLEAPKK